MKKQKVFSEDADFITKATLSEGLEHVLNAIRKWGISYWNYTKWAIIVKIRFGGINGSNKCVVSKEISQGISG